MLGHEPRAQILGLDVRIGWWKQYAVQRAHLVNCLDNWSYMFNYNSSNQQCQESSKLLNPWQIYNLTSKRLLCDRQLTTQLSPKVGRCERQCIVLGSRWRIITQGETILNTVYICVPPYPTTFPFCIPIKIKTALFLIGNEGFKLLDRPSPFVLFWSTYQHINCEIGS